MNKERLEVYRNLIQELLSCPDDQKWELLKAHQELLDSDLIQVMQNKLAEANPDEAKSIAADIVNFSNLIAQFPLGDKASNMEIAIKGYKVALTFRTREAFPYEWAMTQNNLAAAYRESIRGEKAENLERAIAASEHALGVLTREAFPYEWAMTQHNLGNAYSERIQGKKAENLEQAIAAYEQALEVRTQEAFPVDWAATQNSLAVAYWYRIRGEKAENLEQAIAYFQKALEVYTREAFPYEWARTQNNLAAAYWVRIQGRKADNIERAIAAYEQALEVRTQEAFPYDWAITQLNLVPAYSQRIRGEKAENLEKAIACSQKALEVYTRETFPVDWAMTQHNLAATYWLRIRGEKAENLEIAIAAYEQVLEVHTREAFPIYWAMTQNNLGNAYSDRIRGEKAENLEREIDAYKQALKVYTRKAFPVEWARTQNNLAAAYSERIRGEKAENLEIAITAYEQALGIRTKEAFPVDWATTKDNLGKAYSKRIRGEKAENLETAILLYKQALEVYTREAFPYDWAITQHNLAAAYTQRIKGEKAENLEMAIAAYEQVLEVHTREAFPFYWAMTQHHLAAAYTQRIEGEKAENLKIAIAYFQESLEIFTPDAFPLECLETGRNLGNLAFREENWQLAIEAYIKAVEAVEMSRGWAMTPQSKQEVMEAAIDVYHKIVQAYLNTEQRDLRKNKISLIQTVFSGFNWVISKVFERKSQITLALEYVERSKTRNLVELLANRDLKPRGDFPSAILKELKRLRDEIRTEAICLGNQERTYYSALSRSGQSSPSSRPDRTRLNQLQKELDNFIAREITPIDPNFVLTQKVKPIALSEIQALIDQKTAILEWYIGGDRILAFIITSDSLKVWQSTKEDLENLFKWKDEYLEIYKLNKTKWIKTLDCRLNNLRNILHPDRLLELIPDTCNQLILIPHYFLHIFPLHTLPLNNGKFLYECFSKGVGYVPSCQLLKLVQESKSQDQKEFNRLFAIHNPTRKDALLGSNLEIARISQYFDLQSIIIAESQASKTMLVQQRENLKSTHCLHFSCHGKFNSKSPLDSALLLADPEGNLGKSANLTLAEIFEKLDLEKCRLVTLSACESGIIDPTVISDEYIGIPSGFLFAGSLSVVSTLWKVDALATTLFMIKFYRYLKRSSELNQGSIAIASTKAQTWLRNLTSKKLKRIKDSQQFQQLLKEVFQNQKRDYKKFKDSLEAAVKREPYPFVNPYYWTAFIATGI